MLIFDHRCIRHHDISRSYQSQHCLHAVSAKPWVDYDHLTSKAAMSNERWLANLGFIFRPWDWFDYTSFDYASALRGGSSHSARWLDCVLLPRAAIQKHGGTRAFYAICFGAETALCRGMIRGLLRRGRESPWICSIPIIGVKNEGDFLHFTRPLLISSLRWKNKIEGEVRSWFLHESQVSRKNWFKFNWRSG